MTEENAERWSDLAQRFAGSCDSQVALLDRFGTGPASQGTGYEPSSHSKAILRQNTSLFRLYVFCKQRFVVELHPSVGNIAYLKHLLGKILLTMIYCNLENAIIFV